MASEDTVRSTSAVGTAAGPSPLFSAAFLRDYAITMRPYLLFVSGITGLAGMAMAPRGPLGATLLLAAAFFLSYGFGQALTDCFQTDTDALSSPYRPLVAGRITRRNVMATSLGGLALIALVMGIYEPRALPWALLGVAGLATYTWFKRRWWGGPFYNAWIVVVLCWIGWLTGRGAAGAVGEEASAVPPQALPWILLLVLFGYANFVLSGYFKDVSADRATGYRTLPVVFGWRTAAVVSHVFALLAVVFCGTALAMTPGDAPSGRGLIPALLFMIAGAGASLLGQVRLHSVRHESDAHRGIGPVVHAYILLLSATSVARRPDWTLPLLLYYAAYLAVLRARPMQEQI